MYALRMCREIVRLIFASHAGARVMRSLYCTQIQFAWVICACGK